MENDKRVIEGRGRDIILNVAKYFETERNECKELLRSLTTILHYYTINKGNEAKVPMEILSKVVSHLKNTTRVSARVIAATNVNKNTLTKIQREGQQAEINKTKLQTPIKKPRGKKQYFDSSGLNELKSIIQTQNARFSLNKLLAIVRRDLNYSGSKATLRRIISDMGCQIWNSKGKGRCLAPNEKHLQHKVERDKEENSNKIEIEVTILNNEQKDNNPVIAEDSCGEEMIEEYLEFNDPEIDEKNVLETQNYVEENC